jgi:hypothetical protein
VGTFDRATAGTDLVCKVGDKLGLTLGRIEPRLLTCVGSYVTMGLASCGIVGSGVCLPKGAGGADTRSSMLVGDKEGT